MTPKRPQEVAQGERLQSERIGRCPGRGSDDGIKVGDRRASDTAVLTSCAGVNSKEKQADQNKKEAVMKTKTADGKKSLPRRRPRSGRGQAPNAKKSAGCICKALKNLRDLGVACGHRGLAVQRFWFRRTRVAYLFGNGPTTNKKGAAINLQPFELIG